MVQQCVHVSGCPAFIRPNVCAAFYYLLLTVLCLCVCLLLCWLQVDPYTVARLLIKTTLL